MKQVHFWGKSICLREQFSSLCFCDSEVLRRPN
jgi:hypothetical protein